MSNDSREVRNRQALDTSIDTFRLNQISLAKEEMGSFYHEYTEVVKKCMEKGYVRYDYQR